MGDTGSKKTILVKDMWWENGDFHVIDIHGEETIYKNAYFTGYSVPHDDAVVKAEEIVYVGRTNG